MEKLNRKRFWMCYVDNGNYPRCQHWSKEEANVEATRLAILTSNDVFVLEASMFVRPLKPQPPVTWKATVDDY